jgi:hypothetical protein
LRQLGWRDKEKSNAKKKVAKKVVKELSTICQILVKKLPKSCLKVAKKLSKSCQKTCQKITKLKIGCKKTKILKRLGEEEGGGG